MPRACFRSPCKYGYTYRLSSAEWKTHNSADVLIGFPWVHSQLNCQLNCLRVWKDNNVRNPSKVSTSSNLHFAFSLLCTIASNTFNFAWSNKASGVYKFRVEKGTAPSMLSAEVVRPAQSEVYSLRISVTHVFAPSTSEFDEKLSKRM